MFRKLTDAVNKMPPWLFIAMLVIGILFGVIDLTTEKCPNPDNFRPIGTTARIIDAGTWANGHWYAMAASSWSGSDLIRFVPDDFVPGTNAEKNIGAGVLVVQRQNGWAILPQEPPH